MKTAIDISDPLLREARKLAEREEITLRALVERALRRVMAETKPGAPFKLRRASFKGKGLQADARGAPWGRLRELAYEGRGAWSPSTRKAYASPRADRDFNRVGDEGISVTSAIRSAREQCAIGQRRRRFEAYITFGVRYYRYLLQAHTRIWRTELNGVSTH
jgi:hypothetical protein